MHETYQEDLNRHRKARVLFPKEVIIKVLSENENDFLSRNGKGMW